MTETHKKNKKVLLFVSEDKVSNKLNASLNISVNVGMYILCIHK